MGENAYPDETRPDDIVDHGAIARAVDRVRRGEVTDRGDFERELWRAGSSGDASESAVKIGMRRAAKLPGDPIGAKAYLDRLKGSAG